MSKQTDKKFSRAASPAVEAEDQESTKADQEASESSVKATTPEELRQEEWENSIENGKKRDKDKVKKTAADSFGFGQRK